MNTKKLLKESMDLLIEGKTVLVYGVGFKANLNYKIFEEGAAFTEIREYMRFLDKFQKLAGFNTNIAVVTELKNDYVFIENDFNYYDYVKVAAKPY